MLLWLTSSANTLTRSKLDCFRRSRTRCTLTCWHLILPLSSSGSTEMFYITLRNWTKSMGADTAPCNKTRNETQNTKTPIIQLNQNTPWACLKRLLQAVGADSAPTAEYANKNWSTVKTKGHTYPKISSTPTRSQLANQENEANISDRNHSRIQTGSVKGAETAPNKEIGWKLSQ